VVAVVVVVGDVGSLIACRDDPARTRNRPAARKPRSAKPTDPSLNVQLRSDLKLSEQKPSVSRIGAAVLKLSPRPPARPLARARPPAPRPPE
jgi:hypothetical protein